MQFFEIYSSNTLAGSGNQSYFTNENKAEVKTGSLYYKIFCGGKFRYSLLFSNTTDSTYPIGVKSACNTPCAEWEIRECMIGVCGKIGEEPKFTALTFGGKTQKHVMPGELFASDEILIEAEKGSFICIRITFCGSQIPCNYEGLFSSFVLENGKWMPSKLLPVPSMVGCDRPVKKKIAFLGDSVTQGIGTPADSYRNWASLLAGYLGENFSFWNLGLGFGRAADVSTDGAWLYKAKQCDLVAVCFGVNDILQGFPAQEIKQNLKTAVDRLCRANVRVFIQTVPPFDYTGEQIKIWNEINLYIKNDLSKKCAGFFDSVSVLGDAGCPHRAAFGGHPNINGCELWAKALYPEFRRILQFGDGVSGEN